MDLSKIGEGVKFDEELARRVGLMKGLSEDPAFKYSAGELLCGRGRLGSTNDGTAANTLSVTLLRPTLNSWTS